MKTQHSVAAMFAVLAALLIGPMSLAGDKDAKEREDKVGEELRKLKEEIALLRKLHGLSAKATDEELKLLGQRLDRIEKHLEKLSTPTTRSAGFFDPAAAGTGTMRLDNRLGVRATVIIDGVPYSVPPLAVRVLPGQRARTFTYEFTADGFGMSAPRQTRVAAGETWTLTIH
jgi:hypothetical protein